MNAEYSHIAEVTVPLLLHCVTLPCGTDTFCRLIKEEFQNSDWRIRFLAGKRERTTLYFYYIKLNNNNITCI